MDGKYPERLDDPDTGESTWVGADGTYFDQSVHLWNSGTEAPAGYTDGTFVRIDGITAWPIRVYSNKGKFPTWQDNLLAKLETMNTLLIGRGRSYDDRKQELQTFAADWRGLLKAS